MSLRCFVEDMTAGLADGGGARVFRLCEQEARHARLSRRLSVGDTVVLFDGQGRQANGKIVTASKSMVEVAVHDVSMQPRPRPALTLAVAMPKGPRQDVLIEKCTELGVAAIQPLATERSVAGASDHRRDKWRRTTIEAAKQSGQCWLPELLAPGKLEAVLSRAAAFDLVLAAMTPREEPPLGLIEMVGLLREAASVLAFVGPEGGWTPEESRMLMVAGAKCISLGPNVLRIETAAVALAAIAHACSRDKC